jgi:tRNA (guanine6-N2)-methyltransferase
MLRIVDLKKNDSLLDPMCGGATIPIEAALSIEPKKIFASDRNEKYIEGAKKNAEKADVLNKIEFAVKDCKDMTWVGEVDKIITNPPFGVRIGKGRRFLRRLYFNFLNASYDVVNDRICLLSLKSSLFKYVLKKHGKFKIIHERIVGHGNIYPKLFVLEKR